MTLVIYGMQSPCQQGAGLSVLAPLPSMAGQNQSGQPFTIWPMIEHRAANPKFLIQMLHHHQMLRGASLQDGKSFGKHQT